ncbi:DNA polymerase III subunit [uncultured Faecalibaculum sp.]|uniref:DNA polymerase III subunit n=1 Tax=uncultured Faecalibaculum sp. TaxID=1729681 RepID=UPI0025D1C29F|nr:DNA polymerase III subunit [uncultured Faecalibaculum sp.]
MNKSDFFAAQPGAARILQRMLETGRMAHALLFWGPRGAPLQEAAELTAQALVCEHPDAEGFGCGTCLACRNVLQHRGVGLYWNQRLQKKDAADLQEQFSLTSQGQRVSVLEHFDEATPQAANALLKFIEEPQPGITAILTAAERSAVLPTIESRCLCIQLRPMPEKDRSASLDTLPADLRQAAAAAGYGPQDFPEPDEFYARIMPAARQYLSGWDRPEGLLELQLNLFPAKGAHTTRPMVRLFLEALQWQVRQTELPIRDKAMIFDALVQGIEAVKRTADPALVLDQMASRIRKGINHE